MRRARPRRAGPAKDAGAADTALFGGLPYFRSLAPAELRALARRCRPRTLATGETLFEEGAPCAGLFIVAAGRIEVLQVSLRGREQVFHAEGPGATLGEGPLFDGGGYIATAVALVPSRVVLVPRTDVLTLCRQHPEVALAMLEALAQRVRRFAAIVSDLAFHPVKERVARSPCRSRTRSSPRGSARCGSWSRARSGSSRGRASSGERASASSFRTARGWTVLRWVTHARDDRQPSDVSHSATAAALGTLESTLDSWRPSCGEPSSASSWHSSPVSS